jgi:hypothetical protein
MPTTRLTRTLLTVLAALLVVPTVLVRGAAAVSAPVSCLNDVERQFDSLKHHPEALGFHLGAGAFDPTSGRHYQGIVRIPGPGTPTFLTSRNGNPAPQETTGDSQPGEVNVVRLGSRNESGERVRSNRLQANTHVSETPIPAEDAVVRSLKFEGTHIPGGYPAYRHVGGMQMWGDVAVVGMDKPFLWAPAEQPPGTIVLINFSDRDNPFRSAEFPLPHPAGTIGVAEYEPGKLLIVTTGSGGSPVYGYEVLRNGQPTADLSPSGFALSLRPLFEYDAANADIGWPTGFQSLQTTNLFRDCASGQLYLMGGYNLGPFENTSRDRLGRWKLNPTSEPRMEGASKRQIWCDFAFTLRACNMAAASGFHVTASGDLVLYATTHDNDGPDGTVLMAEFSSQDGYDQDGAYRPTAVPGTYEAAVNAPITLDGTASLPALAEARVELYDDVQFKDRSLVVDYPDRGREDYRHLGRVEGFNDKTSSVRWRLPSTCEAVLYDDKDYQGRRYDLPGADGAAQAVDNLRSFGDKATSIEFYGDCDGRVVWWSWDLDDDGTVDATGPTPTITPTSPGVHPLSLTVCSGFGVCDEKVGSLDASAGTVPKTTAVVNGTAGTNGWHRSAVNVVLTTTGDPTPTEIRWSTTGADPMGERAVPGTTATVPVDAQGETVVHFRAVSSSGHEGEQTLTVKVDTVAPALTVRAPVAGGRYVSGSEVTVRVDCTDATSGVATCPANGTALDTVGTGPRTLTVTATDAAGNPASNDVQYTLVAAPSVNAELVYVASSHAGPGPIQRSNADGSNVVQLAASGDDPMWSPDGSKVAYTATVDGRRQVHVTNRDGTATTVVTTSTTWHASSPAWSPDGSRILYVGDWTEAPSPTERIQHFALFAVPATGGAPVTLALIDGVQLRDPSWSRNGAEIVFIANRTIRTIPATGVPAGQLGTVLFGNRIPGEPWWSPDGTTLAFQLTEPEAGISDLFTWPGSGNPVSLTGTATTWPPPEMLDAPNEEGPTWLADGRLVFTQDGNVYLMAAERGAEKVLLADLPYSVRSVDARGA